MKTIIEKEKSNIIALYQIYLILVRFFVNFKE